MMKKRNSSVARVEGHPATPSSSSINPKSKSADKPKAPTEHLVAQWLRIGGGGLETSEAIHTGRGRRVDVFTGMEMIQALAKLGRVKYEVEGVASEPSTPSSPSENPSNASDKGEKDGSSSSQDKPDSPTTSKKGPNVSDELKERLKELTIPQIAGMAQRLLDQRYIMEAKIIKPSAIKRGELQPATIGDAPVTGPMTFSGASRYYWLLDPPATPVAIQALQLLGIVLGVIAICCYRIWPIWLRICIYWLALVLLISLLGTIFLHLASYFVFYIIGFKGTFLHYHSSHPPPSFVYILQP